LETSASSKPPVYLDGGRLFVQKPDGYYMIYSYNDVKDMFTTNPTQMTPQEVFNTLYGINSPHNPYSGIEKGDVSSETITSLVGGTSTTTTTGLYNPYQGMSGMDTLTAALNAANNLYDSARGIWDFITDPKGTINFKHNILNQPLSGRITINETVNNSAGIGSFIAGELRNWGDYGGSIGSVSKLKFERKTVGALDGFGGVMVNADVTDYDFKISAEGVLKAMFNLDFLFKDKRGLNTQISIPLVEGHSGEDGGYLNTYPLAYAPTECMMESYDLLTRHPELAPMYGITGAGGLCLVDKVFIERDIKTRAYAWETEGDRVSDTVTVTDADIGDVWGQLNGDPIADVKVCETRNETTPGLIRDLHSYLYYSNKGFDLIRSIENKINNIWNSVTRWLD